MGGDDWVRIAAITFLTLFAGMLLVLGFATDTPDDGASTDSEASTREDDGGSDGEPETHHGTIKVTRWTNDYHKHLDAAFWTLWEDEVYDSATWEMEPREEDDWFLRETDYKCEGESFTITFGAQTRDKQSVGDKMALSCNADATVKIEVYVSAGGRPSLFCSNCGG